MNSQVGPPEKIGIYFWGTEKLSTPKEYAPETLLYQKIGDAGIYLVTLNRPKKLNPIDLKNSWELLLLSHHLHHHKDCKVVVWIGAGRAFSSGGDFSGGSFSAQSIGIPQEIIDGYCNHKIAYSQPDLALAGIVYQMITLPQPSVCAVNGLAVGGAVNFAFLLHDYCVISDDCKFFFPFSTLGLTPEVGSSFLLPMLTGLPRAKELLMLGNRWDSKKAYDYGLVNDVCPKEEVFRRAMVVAQRLVTVSQTTVRETKRLLNAPIVQQLHSLLEEELRTIQVAATGDDFANAMIAFAKKHAKNKTKKVDTSSKL